MQDAILFWNDVLLEVHRRDYTFDDAVGDDESDAPIDRQNISPEIGGPTRVSRAFAMVHLAMCDALSTITPIRIGGIVVAPYLAGLPAAGPLSLGGAAIGAAASTVLLNLYKHETGFITGKLAEWDASLSAGGAPAAAIVAGYLHGKQVGEAMLKSRVGDGSEVPDVYVPLNVPGTHRPDPFAPTQGALGVKWGEVKPFGEVQPMTTFVPAHPLGAADPGAHINAGAPWAAEVIQTRDKGGISGTPGLTRTPEETLVGIFWGYDGARNLGVPPRLYNQCLQSISRSQALTESENAVLFALANMAMADAGITAWKTKYTYHVSRPVVGIREDAMGFGSGHGASAPTLPALPLLPGAPTPATPAIAAWLGTAAANSSMNGDVTWAPLGAPQTNPKAGDLNQFARTPPFPAYPSGHATFGTACFGIAAEFLRKARPKVDVDKLTFTFVSDEFNGKSVDADLSLRSCHQRTLTLAQAIHENAVSRVYLGVHWPMDAVEGVRTGYDVIRIIKLAPRRGPANIL